MTRPRLLLTGASGFVGRYLRHGLESQFDITTLGRSAGSGVVCDLGRQIPSLPSEPFDAIIHAAGAAHTAGADFMRVNAGGTRRLLGALESAQKSPAAIVYISSVAVYGLTKGENIDETAPVNPASHYGESKARAEEILADWCSATGVKLSILRPPLIAALDAPGNLGKMVRAIYRGRYVSFGAFPGARKSVLTASDLPVVAAKAIATPGGIYNVCADYAPGFREIEQAVQYSLGVRRALHLPQWPLRLLSSVWPTAQKILSHLTFSNELAKSTLVWQPLPWDYDLRRPATLK